jgi:hypothetical protein
LCYYFRFNTGALAINTEFSSRERERFRNLLELAKSSKFDGERSNAMAAATRLAAKHGLSLEEAARFQGNPAQEITPKPRRQPGTSDPFGYPARATAADVSHAARMADEKQRWKDAVENARQRGLDKSEKSRAGAARPKRFNRSRRNPMAHATVLLKETRLSLHEIADISGLDIYAVVGVKLKMRNGAWR